MAHNQALGARGEDRAAAWYLERGYDVADRNWRCAEGELDLVLRRGRTVVFCEVKTRSSSAFGNPEDAVTARKAQRIRRLALRWLDAHGVRAGELRFDVVAITGRDVVVFEDAF